MRKTLLSFAAVALAAIASPADAQERHCYSHERHQELLQENPSLQANMDAIEAFTRRAIALKGKPGSGGGGTDGGGGGGVTEGVITIPVYVHVLWNKSYENISDAQIQSQIAVMNQDFSATNPDVSSTPPEFAGLVANTEIQFTWNPANTTRLYSSKTSWGTQDAMKKSRRGGSDPVPGYLNMWVCNIGGGILGYAQFPGGDPATDGVVMGPNYFGSSDYNDGSFYLSAPFDKGRTTTHEVGHWMNLRHIWGDGGCGATDYVADTPDSDGPNYGCPSYPSVACGTNDMTMNYMDYTDDACMTMFSLGQKDRMRAVFAPGGPRASMVGRYDASTIETEVSIRVNEFSVSLFPNPAASMASVSIALPEPANLSVSLVDLQGRSISMQQFDNASGVLTHSFDVSNLAAGVYFVQVEGGNYRSVQKLVVTE